MSGGGLTLESLLGPPSSAPEKEEAPPKSNGVKRRTSELCPFIEVGPQEIRDAHMKAAVFPSEKPELERMVHAVHDCSVSDLLRDFLLLEYKKAKEEGKI